jgi:hypothetical protein
MRGERQRERGRPPGGAAHGTAERGFDSTGRFSDDLVDPSKTRRRPKELFARRFEGLLLFVYHCFDRLVINGSRWGLSRPEQGVYFFREVIGVPVISKEVLSKRTNDYQHGGEAFARNPSIPIEWAERGVRQEDYVRPALRRMERQQQYGVYSILKSMEQGFTFRSSSPRYRSADPHYRILAGECHRFTPYYYFDLRKMRAHGLIERDGHRYAYRSTARGIRVSVLFDLVSPTAVRPLGPLALSPPTGSQLRAKR